tara:strand:- start:41 stop:370 length:330 start_codon:yes stop_codon:yes gene_type:complete
MEQLPEFNENTLLNIYMRKIREHITIYIQSNNLKTTFYNTSEFFLMNKIDDKELKSEIFYKIVKELLNKKLYVAHVFNKTGIVITKNKEDFDNNVWCSNLDFTPLSLEK